ncbi:MAG: SMC family ATPase [Geobacteraceae bacterium]|nr:SMC family ATPase [Geobacteraceae bacterium]
MRPLKLTMQAFGPFATCEMVDFTAFGDNAFFLIHGPTGAGKTSILDAICYALYGSPSGSTRDERTLRSQHAKNDLLCEVEFLFQIGPRRFHIWRSPEQVIEKKGKEQKTIHKVELCEVDSTGTIIGDRYSKVGEVKDKVESILGFTADQFSQVVVLPQGEFRKLLLASSTDKEKILEKLFATERFKRIENLLKDRRDALYKGLEGIRNTVSGLLESQRVDTVENLKLKGEDLSARENELNERSSAAVQKQQQATENLQQGLLTAAKFTRLEKAKTEVALLDGQRETMTVLGTRTERGKRALSLVDLDEALAQDHRQQSELAEQITRLNENLARQNGELSIAIGQRDELSLQIETIPAKTTEKATLEGRLTLLSDVTSVEQEQKEALQKRTEATAALEKLKAEILTSEDGIATSGRKIEELALSVGRRGELEQRIKESSVYIVARQNLSDAVGRGEKLAEDRSGLVARCVEAESLLTKSTIEHDELASRLIHGQAAQLAKELADGKPCPVCGSPDHPQPAAGGEEIPSKEELAAARLKVDNARKKSDQTKAALSAHDVTAGEVKAGIAALLQQLGKLAETPLVELQTAKAILDNDLNKVTADEKELINIRARREKMFSLLEADKGKIAAATSALQVSATQVDTLQGQLQAKQKELGEGERDQVAIRSKISALEKFIKETNSQFKSLEERTSILQQESSASKGQKEEAERTAVELAGRVQSAEEKFTARLVQACFANEDAYRAARISADDLEKSERSLKAYQDKVAAASAELIQAESASASLLKPDIDCLTALQTVAEEEVATLSGERGGVVTQFVAVRQTIAAIDTYLQESEVKERLLKSVGNLANLAAGNNPKRITLQRFVLASLFEEVALAASERLSRMSRGRYHLRRSESVEDARRGAGLDLEVTDDFTGLHRPASTLSGGETFLASLSLALGLSDIVLAQSGGRYLDTLFIDEGFGTLDSETLDIAMDTLVRLNEQGRMVGIISHVSELKEQIPKQLQIIAGRNGSRVNVVN